MAVDPTGAVVRNALQLQRIGNGINAEVAALLRELFDELAAELVRIDPTGVDGEGRRRARVQRLIEAMDELTFEQYELVSSLVRDRIARVGSLQARWAVEQLKRTIGSIDVRVGAADFGINLAKALLDRNPIQGDLLASWFSSSSDATRARVRREIQLGMAQNETVNDMVKRLRGEGGAMNASAHAAESIVRTAVNDISNAAHMATWEENRDVTKKFRVVATLDGNTTAVCASLDGTEWEYDDPDAPAFPKHIRCRTVTVPVVDWEGLGLEPPPEGTRASADGPVPSSTTYTQWFRDQDAEDQDEIFGPTRARLFREGKVTLRDLVNDDGKIVNVADLN